MTRPLVGIDLDNVIYDWEGTARRFVRDVWGRTLPPSSDYDDIQNALMPIEWDALMGEAGVYWGLWELGLLVDGATHGLERLRERFDLAVITRRPAVARAATFRLVARLAPTIIATIEPSDPRSKGQVLDCAWYVDDSPAELEKLEAEGRTVYMFDQAWNKRCRAGARVKGWGGLLKEVLG